MRPDRIPGSTYRLQFNAGFTFRQAIAILDYLQDLGVTDVYASPISRARRGSTHGYDVTDPGEINPEIGTPDDFEHFAAMLRDRRMGLLIDIVPNHMAASLENDWWFDLLARGPSSPAARHFDVDWTPAGGRGGLRNRLLLPVLGRPYGEVLEAREIRVTLDDEDGFSIRYFDHRFPMSAASLRLLAIWLREEIDEPDASRSLSLLAAEEDPRAVADGILAVAPPKSAHRRALRRLVSRVNSGRHTTPSFSELDRLLDLQHYRLSFWRLASAELNYRRFFDISELAGLRVEERETFEAVHRLPLELARRGIATGLRIDHVDGLRDPVGYLERLQDALPGKHFYVVIEKIFAIDEPMRPEFVASGTTGYEFLNSINRPFVDPSGLEQIDRFYREFTDRPFTFSNVVYRMKRVAIKRLLPGELNRLAARCASLAARDRVGRDITFSDLRRALIEISACLPVYRTYIRDGSPARADRALIEGAARAAKELNPSVLHPAIEFVSKSLQLQLSEESEPQKEDWVDLVMRWQQFTGPAMAKGFEDTALYRANRLIALNEVGSDPDPGPEFFTIEAFHEAAQARIERMPHTLNASSTHDTKRSEDVRARIDALSEVPDRWIRLVKQWHQWNDQFRTAVGDRRAPGFNEEWLLYQTLVGAWPLREEEAPSFRKRLETYLIKAAREAKMHTSWLEPDEEWEKAIVRFAQKVTDPAQAPRFIRDFRRFQREIAFRGALTSLAQLVLKATAPGVPDFYQGTELWDFSLVDPDNRRPVDYESRRNALQQLRSRPSEGDRVELCRELLHRWKDGRVKLWVTSRLLDARRSHIEAFRDGGYHPLDVKGDRADHAIAFRRGSGKNAAIVLVPRLVSSLSEAGTFPLGAEIWGDTAVPVGRAGALRNIFTDEKIPMKSTSLRLSRALANFPVAVLVPA